MAEVAARAAAAQVAAVQAELADTRAKLRDALARAPPPLPPLPPLHEPAGGGGGSSPGLADAADAESRWRVEHALCAMEIGSLEATLEATLGVLARRGYGAPPDETVTAQGEVADARGDAAAARAELSSLQRLLAEARVRAEAAEAAETAARAV